MRLLSLVLAVLVFLMPNSLCFAESVCCDETQAIEKITIEKHPLVLKSKLKKEFSAYSVSIKSSHPHTLRIMNANIANGTTGDGAASQVYTSKANMFWSALLGGAGLIVIGLPTLAVISASNGKAEREGLAFTNQIPIRELRNGESITVKALVPKGQTPSINFTFKDINQDSIFISNSN